MTGQPSIYHIASPEDAAVLRAASMLAPPSLAAEGFVHCSTAEQVVATTARYFPPDAELVLIELDPAAVGAEISWPEVYPGQRFPHLHGPMPATAVVAIHPWGPDDRVRWRV